jgi:hypothetical protein
MTNVSTAHTNDHRERSVLQPVSCPWCGSDDVVPGSHCPRSIPCPKCTARAGQRCKRPSGHPAGMIHAERIKIAEAMDR